MINMNSNANECLIWRIVWHCDIDFCCTHPFASAAREELLSRPGWWGDIACWAKWMWNDFNELKLKLWTALKLETTQECLQLHFTLLQLQRANTLLAFAFVHDFCSCIHGSHWEMLMKFVSFQFSFIFYLMLFLELFSFE